jgi:hypothetical protein
LGVFFGTTPKLLISKWLPHYCEGEISGPSFRFKGEKSLAMFQIKLEFFGYSVIIFGLFWAMNEKFLSKSGNYFSQIVEF